MTDKNALIEFAKNIPGNDLNKGIDDKTSSEKLLDILPSLSDKEMENIGIQSYDDNTGEIEFTKNKSPIVDVSINPDTGYREYQYRCIPSFKDMQHKDEIAKDTLEQIRLW